MIKKDIMKEEYLNHGSMDERRMFSMADVSGRGEDLDIEVNWNKYVRKNGFIKFIMGDKEVVVSREHLYAILFLLGSASEQEKMASPFTQQRRVIKYFKMLGITAMKDIKKGDMLNVPLEFTLNPYSNQVVIGKGSIGVMNKLLSKQKLDEK